MKLEDLIKKVGNLPAVETEILLAGVADPKPLKVQISRWQKADKLIQLKRGIYLLSEPYRKLGVNHYYIASILQKPSYISLEKALEYYDLIPEAVRVFTSVTTKRPAEFNTRVGVFNYRHIKEPLFWGYRSVAIEGQVVFIAHPEKALLDFVYLRGAVLTGNYLEELRLQNTGIIDPVKLKEYAAKFKKPGILRAAGTIAEFIRSRQGKEKTL